jgi:LPXTG-motif cell wall-anchored protein
LPAGSSGVLCRSEQRATAHSRYNSRMDTNTLLIIIVVILLLGGGGFFYRGRR